MKYQTLADEEYDDGSLFALNPQNQNAIASQIKQVIREYQREIGKALDAAVESAAHGVYAKMQKIRARWGTAVVDEVLQTEPFRLSYDADGYDSIEEIEAAMEALRRSQIA